jgi:hypothetical protein
LAGIARLARLIPQHSLASVQRLLANQVSAIHQLLSAEMLSPDQRKYMWQAKRWTEFIDELILERFLHFLHEHIHWLLMISGYILADTGKGEHPMVPVALMKLSIHQVSNCDNVDVAASDARPQSNYGPDNDQVVQLSKTIFDLGMLLTRDPNTCDISRFSPLVTKTLFWNLERWTRTYLLINDEEYNVMR